MTRGRKKNLDLPPTRSLQQQRAFRARKAQYVADLEDRCKKAEAENEILRKEVTDFRAALPIRSTAPIANPELLRASLDLMHNLSSTSASLARFQELYLQITSTSGSNVTSLNSNGLALPAITANAATLHSISPINHSLSVANFGPCDNDDGALDSRSDLSDDLYSPNCCGAMLDCRSLIEEDNGLHQQSISRTRVSGLRSTSQSSPTNI